MELSNAIESTLPRTARHSGNSRPKASIDTRLGVSATLPHVARHSGNSRLEPSTAIHLGVSATLQPIASTSLASTPERELVDWA